MLTQWAALGWALHACGLDPTCLQSNITPLLRFKTAMASAAAALLSARAPQ